MAANNENAAGWLCSLVSSHAGTVFPCYRLLLCLSSLSPSIHHVCRNPERFQSLLEKPKEHLSIV